MVRLPMLGGKVALANLSKVAVPTSEGSENPIYQTPAYRAWRERVIANAGRRCEWLDGGVRCPKSEPRNRMFADHRIELKDGGAPFDPSNGQCFCGAHHTIKTNMARVARMSR